MKIADRVRKECKHYCGWLGSGMAMGRADRGEKFIEGLRKRLQEWDEGDEERRIEVMMELWDYIGEWM